MSSYWFFGLLFAYNERHSKELFRCAKAFQCEADPSFSLSQVAVTKKCVQEMEQASEYSVYCREARHTFWRFSFLYEPVFCHPQP